MPRTVEYHIPSSPELRVAPMYDFRGWLRQDGVEVLVLGQRGTCLDGLKAIASERDDAREALARVLEEHAGVIAGLQREHQRFKSNAEHQMETDRVMLAKRREELLQLQRLADSRADRLDRFRQASDERVQQLQHALDFSGSWPECVGFIHERREAWDNLGRLALDLRRAQDGQRALQAAHDELARMPLAVIAWTRLKAWWSG